MRLLALIIALLLGTSRCAQATCVSTVVTGAELLVSGFDTPDNDSTTTGDSVEFTERTGGSGADADCEIVRAASPGGGDRVHDAANGGSDSSKHALLANVTTGNSRYYTLKSDLQTGLTAASVSISASLETAPSASNERTFLAFYETGNPTPGTPGCFVTVNNAKQLSLYYSSTSNNWGTTSTTNGALRHDACGQSPTFACTTAANDCPNGPADACTAIYWAGVELTQIRNGGTVDCELRQDGTLILGGTYKTAAGGTILQVGVGALDVSAVTGGLKLYLDDLVVSSATRAGFGYVATRVPLTVGVTQTWKTDLDCYVSGSYTSTPANRALCLDDYGIDSGNGYIYNDNSNTNQDGIQQTQKGKQQDISRFQPDLTLRQGEKATAAELVVVGRTSTQNADRELTSDMLLCPIGACGDTCNTTAGVCTVATAHSCTVNGDCAAYCTAGNPGDACTSDANCCTRMPGPTTQITANAQLTVPTLFHRFLVTAPTAIPGTSWSTAMNWIGWSVTSTQNGNTQVTRIGAVVAYVRIRKSDSTFLEGATLKDHNAVGALCSSDADCGGTCASNKCSGSGFPCVTTADCGGTTGVCVANRCTNGKDGKITLCLVGDSTLQGTVDAECVGGTAAPHTTCTQESYCSWDDPQQKDKPHGGCGSFCNGTCTGDCDAACKTCTLRRNEFGNNAGYRCTGDPDCALGNCIATGGGTCDAGLANCCANDHSVPCSAPGANSECALGTCQLLNTDGSAVTCTESCKGGGLCPLARTGWGGPVEDGVYADTVLACGKGSEDTGEMFADRAAGILAGTSYPGLCIAPVGNGRCACASSGDCAGGTCDTGLGVCTTGAKSTCVETADCSQGFVCQFSPCDYVIPIEGYNDSFIGNLFDPGLAYDHDPQCVLDLAASGGTNQPPKWCPPIGTGASYSCPVTQCTQDSQCLGDSPCAGAGTAAAVPICTGALFGPTCTAIMTVCGQDADCDFSLNGAYAGATGHGVCDNEVTTLSRIPTGRCHCTADAQCPTGFVCGGAVGSKVCRKSCATDSQCGYCTTSADCGGGTCTSNHCAGSCASSVCKGRCGCASNAISCTKDIDCGGTTVATRGGRLRKHVFRGICNPDSLTCAATGLAVCPETTALKGPCSCGTIGSNTADCGGGGICSAAHVCTSGTATRLDCSDDSQCAKTHRCMSAWAAHAAYRRGHFSLATEVWTRWGHIMAASSPTPPVLMTVGLPATSGLTSQGAVIPDAPCLFGFNLDLAYHKTVIGDALHSAGCSCTADAECGTGGQCREGSCLFGALARTNCVRDADCAAKRRCQWFKPQHLIDFTNSGFDTGRMTNAYHVDAVHPTDIGGALIGATVTDGVQRLNVCLKRNSGGTTQACECASSVDCGPGGVCDLTTGSDTQGTCTSGPSARTACGWHTDCAAGKRCGRVQRYCKTPAGTYSGTLCLTQADCTSGQACVRRRCDGEGNSCSVNADCPLANCVSGHCTACTGSNDTCGAD